MEKSNNIQYTTSSRNLNIREELAKYLKFWPWFLLGLVLSVGGAFIYLRYSTPVYSATASIIINEDSGKGGGSEMSSYSDFGFISGLNTNSIEKEIAILRSRRLMRDVVSALNLNIQYFKEGKVRDIELYADLPFSLKILKIDEDRIHEFGGRYVISQTSNSKLQIINLQNQKSIQASAGSPVNLGFADVVISPNPGQKSFSNIIIQFSTIDNIASKYKGRVQLNQADKSSNVIELVLEDPVKEKARDIIDQLILEFNRDAIEDKNLIAGNTANFINERLEIINDELEIVETGKEEFKESNRLTDIQAESQMYMRNASEYNERRQEVGTQMELATAMLEYMSSSSNSELLPANLGIQESGVNQQIGEYNDLVLERNRILGGSTEKNPVVIRLNSRIDQIKSNILQSLQRLRTNLQISLDDLRRQSSSIGSRILAVPSQEREYRGIERQQGIKETLYLFLLQKREENSLALAVTAPKAKIVDRAYSSGAIVSPNSRSILMGSVVLGLFIPFSMVYIKDLLDNKIRSRKDIESITKDIPFLGELPRVKKRKNLTVGQNDRSVLAESFRILITNLQYLLVNKNKNKRGVKVLVTSTVKGEGKTFTSVNLALTLANTGKKVLLIGADLRNPKLQLFRADKSKNLGLSDFLVNNELCLQSLIDKTTLHPDLDILVSGSTPPNPSELLRQEKIGEMFGDLETLYDYLIIDSAPSMLVTDTFLISKYVDVTLYIIRSGFTEKNLIEFPIDAQKTETLSNLSFVLSDVDFTNLGYGNKYGYGYGEEKKSLWK